jgi:hypothetical protein
MVASLLDLVQPGQTGRTDIASDMHVASSLLGGNSADIIGNPTYEQILQGLLTSGTPEGAKAAGDYAKSLYGEYYTPGGSRDLYETGQSYAQANNIDYSGGGGSGNNWYPGAEPNRPAGPPSSGFTMGGADPFASANIGGVGGMAPWDIPRMGLNNRIPWQLRNTLGPGVVRNVQTQAPERGVGTLFPGSVAYAPFHSHPSAPPQGEGQWLGNQMRDAWGRLLGAHGRGYNIS